VFAKYVSVVRTLQTVYWLEPAGSKGVWGLDDYCFLPFYWGSSQLFENEKISPDDINDPIILREACADYMYLDCIVFIKKALC
jgi:serine/threonine-protein phosphatase 2A activator